MKTTKILINFSTRHCVHCEAHRGSDEYKAMIKKGYVEVGTIRQPAGGTDVQIYWESEYFNPADKYIANPSPNTDTTTT